MQKALRKGAVLILCIVIFTLFQGFSFATNETVELVKKEENQYIIYISNLLKENFEFAFSNDKNANINNLTFIDSAVDSSKDANNIAFITPELYTKFFENNKVYLWARQNNVYQLEAYKLDLSKSLSVDDVQFINNITKRISIKIGKKEFPQEVRPDGVKVERKIDTIIITDNKNANYSYYIMKSAKGTDVERLIKLSEEINNSNNKNINEKIALYNEFFGQYNKIKPIINDTRWQKVENYTIEEPLDTKDGDQYLVWIKQDSNIDLQIMSCKEEHLKEYKNILISGDVKLPISGDSIALFVIMGIIIISIIVLVGLKIKGTKKKMK